MWVVPKCQNVDLLPYYWTKTSFWSFSDCGRALRLQVLCSSFMIFHSSHYHPHNTRLLTEKLNAGVGGPTKPKVALFSDNEKS